MNPYQHQSRNTPKVVSMATFKKYQVQRLVALP